MSEKPLIFSAPMVRAILEGRKSQTRRVLKPQPEADFISATFGETTMTMRPAMLFGGPTHKMLQRLTHPGCTLWVKEAWHSVVGYDARKPRDIPEDTPIFYCAGPHPETGWIWGRPRSALSMPRWASRITLRVKGVKVERLQDISPDDARAEGCCVGERDEGLPDGREVEAFRDLWTSTSGPGSWEANPWVAAISFERINP